MVEKRKELNWITTLPNDQKCVSMVKFDGTIYVATEHSVYRMNPLGNLEPVKFLVEEDNEKFRDNSR